MQIWEKVAHFSSRTWKPVVIILPYSGSVAWLLQNLCSANTLVQHYFKLAYSTSIHHHPWKMTLKLDGFICKRLDKLLEGSTIVPASVAWSFHVVIARKKDGTARICVDYRSLKRVMEVDGWHLPRIEETFNDLQSCTVFIASDLFTRNLQLQLSETCNELTTFVTCFGTYQFEVMAIGPMNVYFTFQQMIKVVL